MGLVAARRKSDHKASRGQTHQIGIPSRRRREPSDRDYSFRTALTLRVAVDSFLAHCHARLLSGNSVGMYSDALSRLQDSVGCDTPIDEVTLRDLREHLVREQRRGLSPKTLKTRRQNIQRFFHFLLDEELIEVDPSAKLPEYRVPEKTPKPVAIRDVQAILDYLNDGTLKGMRDQLLVLLMVDTGGRVSEVANIAIDDIDWERSKIRIVQKGGDEEFLNISHPTKLALMRYVRRLAQQNDPPVYLFENPVTGRPLTRTAIHKIIRKAGLHENIPGLHPHRFRTTFASEYANTSGDAFALQRELRHKDIQTSLRYVKLFSHTVDRKHQQHSPASKLIVHRRRERG